MERLSSLSSSLFKSVLRDDSSIGTKRGPIVAPPKIILPALERLVLSTIHCADARLFLASSKRNSNGSSNDGKSQIMSHYERDLVLRLAAKQELNSKTQDMSSSSSSFSISSSSSSSSLRSHSKSVGQKPQNKTPLYSDTESEEEDVEDHEEGDNRTCYFYEQLTVREEDGGRSKVSQQRWGPIDGTFCGIFGQSVKSFLPVYVHDSYNNPSYNGTVDINTKGAGMICCPIISAHRHLLGVLQVSVNGMAHLDALSLMAPNKTFGKFIIIDNDGIVRQKGRRGAKESADDQKISCAVGAVVMLCTQLGIVLEFYRHVNNANSSTIVRNKHQLARMFSLWCKVEEVDPRQFINYDFLSKNNNNNNGEDHSSSSTSGASGVSGANGASGSEANEEKKKMEISGLTSEEQEEKKMVEEKMTEEKNNVVDKEEKTTAKKLEKEKQAEEMQKAKVKEEMQKAKEKEKQAEEMQKAKEKEEMRKKKAKEEEEERKKKEKKEKEKENKLTWQKVYDPSSGHNYYYCIETEETTWDTPTDFDENRSMQRERNASMQMSLSEMPHGLALLLAARKIQSVYRAKQARKKMRSKRAEKELASRPNTPAGGGGQLKWIKMHDAHSGYDYYYNNEDHSTMWDVPEDYVDSAVLMEEEEVTVDDWSAVYDSSSGHYYYMNLITQETQWEKPEAFDSEAAKKRERNASIQMSLSEMPHGLALLLAAKKIQSVYRAKQARKKMRAKRAEKVVASRPSTPAVQGGATAWQSPWVEMYDQHSGYPYWYNSVTHETSWMDPKPQESIDQLLRERIDNLTSALDDADDMDVLVAIVQMIPEEDAFDSLRALAKEKLDIYQQETEELLQQQSGESVHL